MPPEYYTVFLEDTDLPRPDAVLGDDEDDAAGETPDLAELQSDPDVAVVLAAAPTLVGAGSR
jgi:hypothetical protein